MKAHDLAKRLLALPNREVNIFWDGAARGDVEGIVNDKEIVLVGDWSIYRDGPYRMYAEDKIIFG